MTDVESPSPIIESFVRAVERNFPEEERRKLAPHEEAIAQTTSKGDTHRAWRCLEWALTKADDKSSTHPRWKELHELHQVLKDTWFAVDFGVFSRAAGRGEPLQDVKIEWTEHAVAVAQALGEEEGWDHSPWEDLLVELVGVHADPSDEA